MKYTLALLIAFLVPLTASPAADSTPNSGRRHVVPSHATDWLRDARLGAFMHFWASSDKEMAKVDAFDAGAVTRQLKEMGASYLVLTLGQNAGFYNAPNPTYDEFLGCAPGERCSRRDLPLELFRALQPEGIRLMLYLPCQVPNQDARAQRAFGLPEGRKDQPINEEFARKWAKVINWWSAHYGDKVSGWWFDGGYQRIQFSETIAGIYAEAVKSGNPQAIVTFNPGVRLIHYTRAEDYTAGELRDPFDVLPVSRWMDGSQWHALTYLGSSWGGRDVRYPTERWIKWVVEATARGGAVTLDMGPNHQAETAPIGTFSDAQAAQFKAIRQALPPQGNGFAQSSANPSPGEPTNAKEAVEQKAKTDALIEARYQALVAKLPPDQQAWERVLQSQLGGFYLPLHKRAKIAGQSTAWDFVQDDPRLPRVLLIGDSVSRGYTLPVRAALAGKANVHRAPANCGPTANGLKNIEIWLGDGKWDVIHFNFGIHDRNTPIADYTKSLERLIERMKKTGATLIWASTTPIPDDLPKKQTAASIVERNKAAAALMKKHGVAIDDLFSAIEPHLKEMQNRNDVHFNAKGYDFLGKTAAETIAAHLPKN